MAIATAAGVATTRTDLSAHVTLWIVLTAIISCGTACLWSAGLQVDLGSTLLMAELIVSFVLLAWISWLFGRMFFDFDILRRLTATFQDFFFSAAQLTALAAASGLLIYLAANAGATFPMRDDILEYFDSLLGFEWNVISYWLDSHPVLDEVLLHAYDSVVPQIAIITILGSILFPGQRNKEFFTLFLVSVLITNLVFIFVPAVGPLGKADVDSLNHLLDIRAGSSIMTYNRTLSLITFPSYHAALAVVITYSARYRYWSLLPFFLLNAIMLAATPPEGGHYLVDILAGALVALASILIVRRRLVCYEP